MTQRRVLSKGIGPLWCRSQKERSPGQHECEEIKVHTCTLHRMRVTSTSLYCIVCYCTFQLGCCHSFIPAQRTCDLLITSTSASIYLIIFRLIYRQEILLIIIVVEYLNKEVNRSFFFQINLSFLILKSGYWLWILSRNIFILCLTNIMTVQLWSIELENTVFIINFLHFITRNKL